MAENPEVDNEDFAHQYVTDRIDEHKRDPSPINMKKNIAAKDFKNLRLVKARQIFGFEKEKTAKKAAHVDKKGEIPRFPFSIDRGLKTHEKHEAEH